MFEIVAEVLGQRRPPRGRKDVEAHCEEVDEQHAQHEGGDGEQPEGDPGRHLVEHAVGPQRGEDAQGYGDDQGDELGQHEELDGDRQGLLDGLAHRLPVEVGGTQVAVEAVVQVLDVLAW